MAMAMVGASACTPSIPTLPSEGGPAWREVQTEHFTVWSDASPDRARDIARDMERRRAIVLSAMHGGGAATRTFVVAPRDHIEASAYLKGQFAVRSLNARLLGQPGMVIAANWFRDPDINYMVAAQLSRTIAEHQPSWLATGIATYFERFSVRPGTDTVELGLAPQSDLQLLHSSYPMPADALFSCATQSCRTAAFFATSWAMFAFLLDHHHDALDRFIQAYDALWRDDPVTVWYDTTFDASKREVEQAQARFAAKARARMLEAWQAAFPELTPDRLDAELREWVNADQFHVLRISARLPDAPVTERVLGEADALAVRSLLGFEYLEDISQARADANAALALDRTNVLARLLLAAASHSIALDDARATVAAHPDDWRALRLIEFALHDTPEGGRTLDRICAMSANAAPECAAHRRSRPQQGVATGK